MFVRTKTISGKNYAYLVESYWTKQGTRQKVKAYLGRVRKLADTDFSQGNDLNQLLRGFLKQLGFGKTQNFGGEVYELKLDKMIYCNLDAKSVFVGNNKPACLEVNEGFFCTQTIQDLLDLPATITDVDEKDRPEKVASTIVAAGIIIEPQCFITLYQKIAPKPKPTRDIVDTLEDEN